MLVQYRRIKKEQQGNVLFFRLGDFYEMFAEDAIEISRLLNLTLTHRNGLPMCGIPYHSVRSYIARLLKFGKKIAICEQVGEPAKGKTLIEREVVEVISPGTTVDEEFLDKGSANYLASLFGTENLVSFAYIDLSSGEFCACSFPYNESENRLRQELERLDPREIVVQESLLRLRPPLSRAIEDRNGLAVNRWTDWLFDADRSIERLRRQFGVLRLDGLGLDETSPELVAAGALLDYLDDTAKSLIPHVCRLRLYNEEEFVWVDESSQRNLELIRNLRDGDKRFTLLETLDETKTGMGRRLLKQRLTHPLRDLDKVNKRLDMTEFFYHEQKTLSRLRDVLAGTPDLERLSSRVAMNKAHGKDLFSLKNALAAFEKCSELLAESGKQVDFEAEEAILLDEAAFGRLIALKDRLTQGLCDDPSMLLTEGKLIRGGFNAELDRLHGLRDKGRGLLEDYLEEEKRDTGISSLKIRYNRMLGYHFEVTSVHLTKVPSYFIRRQGLASAERFTTERLASLDSEINGASDKIIELEKTLFLALREEVKAALHAIVAAVKRLAELDVAQSLARAATVQTWTRPIVDGENRLNIIEGRHPVVEAHLKRGEFIPNDVILDAREGGGEGTETDSHRSFALITGPNMAGKSTYLRQAALITIMAQMGSFIPAKTAEIGIVDRIYCRVGASDNLARGESTFLVEMLETAAILNSAGSRSLVIMDEVGRGTGTRDGLAIAQAVSEYLLNHIQCRTLFATHYHELAALRHPRLANRSLEVTSGEGGEIIFRRRLVEGAAAESYGLHVARLAGLCESVLHRAEEIMRGLKAHNIGPADTARPADTTGPADTVAPADTARPADTTEENPEATPNPISPNIQNWYQEGGQKVLAEIMKLDINTINPIEALNKINRWRKSLASDKPKKAREQSGPSLFD
jgi:DNA mismatch repair protein MutS